LDFPATEDARSGEESERTMRTETSKVTCSKNSAKKISRLIQNLGFYALLGFASPTIADTPITGPNISGTWSPSGNCYIIVSDCTVPSGQSLTIQPGTCVKIAQGVSLTVNGMIQAVGTPVQRITIQAPISSQTWNTIVAQGTAGTNQFKYCDFSNATSALDFRGTSINEVKNCNFQNAGYGIIFRDNSVNAAMFCNFQNVTNGIWMTTQLGGLVPYTWTQTTKIMNCTFTNVSVQSIYGEAYGIAVYFGQVAHAAINSSIRNCTFHGVGAGCRFNLGGAIYGSSIGRGYGDLQIMNSVFDNVVNSAIWLSADSYAGGGPATFINNTILHAGSGVIVQDPWDARVQSCLFVGCTNAVTDRGTLSRDVSYNGFYGNGTNFVGYNTNSYGSEIWSNRNGTPGDLLLNIFQDPNFVAANDFHLQTNSPAIDAGSPDWAYTDMCFTNGVSQGTSFPDLGAYGGSDAANWLDVVPKVPVQAFLTKTSGTTWVNWGALPRSSYQVQYLASLSTVGTNVWTNFTGGLVLATDKPTSLQVATGTATNKMFFRVQSLGRAVGN
jgi:hypothetical protein